MNCGALFLIESKIGCDMCGTDENTFTELDQNNFESFYLNRKLNLNEIWVLVYVEAFELSADFKLVLWNLTIRE